MSSDEEKFKILMCQIYQLLMLWLVTGLSQEIPYAKVINNFPIILPKLFKVLF